MSGPIVVMPADDLARLVREQVDSALAERDEQPDVPALLDRRGMSRALGVGVDTLDRLRSEGLPELRVGDMPRFCAADVLTWLRERGGDAR